MTAEALAFGTADLTNCDRELIHIPGSVQPHGCLLALDPGGLRVVQAGGATAALLGVAPENLVSRRLSERIGEAMVKTIGGCLAMAPDARRLFTFDTAVTPIGRALEATAHMAGGLLVVELEPAMTPDDSPQDAFGLVQHLAGRIQRAASLQTFCDALVGCVREVSGFDRVMLYRFLPDGAGAVEAEALGPGVDSYLGLRYPASDIPRQARELYLRNTIRLIPDAGYAPALLIADPNVDQAGPLDLSHSVLRSVSPIHLEYLANMGVAASMSLSIVIEGQLWGLIACHHRSPRFLPAQIRTALDLFAQMASFQLETRLATEALAERSRGAAIHDALIVEVAAGADINDGLRRMRQSLLDLIPASGLALWVDGAFAEIGQTPGRAEVAGFIEWLNRSVSEGVFQTDHLSAHYPPARDWTETAAGALAISVSRVPRDYLIWFRPEQIQTVHWAGDPQKPVAMDGGGVRLSPRKSFEAWKAEVRGRSSPWTTLDIGTATSLRVSLLEVLLEHVDQLARERQQARVQQDALLAQLDDRILQWERTADQLKSESDRRAVVEAELSEVLRRTVIDLEAERQRIARELHDNLGQYLAAIQMDLEGLSRDEAAPVSIAARLDRLKGMTAEAGQELDHLAWEIRPTALDDLGLQTAVEQFVEQWAERSALTFDLHLGLHSRRLDPAIESTLYRALQEAIRNVVRHAEASRVGIILTAKPDEVRLVIEDDGRGFVLDDKPGAPSQSRLGLLGMRERLALVGGHLEIETMPGRGTTLLIHVPI